MRRSLLTPLALMLLGVDVLYADTVGDPNLPIVPPTTPTTAAPSTTAATNAPPVTAAPSSGGDSAAQHCEMRDFAETEGQDYAAYNEETGTDIENCKKMCFADSKCKSTMFKNTQCVFYASNKGSYTSAPGNTLSKKLCYSESSRNQNCNMRDLTGNKGQDYSHYYTAAGSNLESCKMACFQDPHCQATEWRNNFCYYFSTNMASLNPGSTMSQKSCSGQFDQSQSQSSQSCQMRDFSDNQGQQYALYTTVTGGNHEECKQKCFQNSQCKATEYKNSGCAFYSTNNGAPSSGSKLAKKLCGDEKQQQGHSSFSRNCQMKDFINNKGEDYAKYKSESGLNLQDCKKTCFADDMCKSTEYFSNICHYYTTSTGSSQTSRKLSKKLCDPCNQPQYMGNRQCSNDVQRYFYNHESKQCQMFIYGGCGGTDNNFVFMDECRSTCNEQGRDQGSEQCEMDDMADTQGQDYAAYNSEVGPNIEECKRRCFQDSQCQSTDFRSSNCNYYSTNKGVYAAGFKLSRKVCGQKKESFNAWNMQQSNNEVCSMKDDSGYKGSDYAIYNTNSGSNIDDCKRMCWKDPFCRATEYRQNCVFFNTAHKTASSGSTMSRKMCAPDHSNQAKNYRRYDQCQMKDKMNSKGQDYASYKQETGNNLEDCKSRCFNDYNCRATEFRQNQCWFFKTNHDSSNSGTMLSQKFCQQDQHSQENGNQMNMQRYNQECQMKDKENSKGQDYAAYEQQPGSNLVECKSKCFKEFNCKATEYKQNQCFFYSTNQASANSGQTLSQKFCQDQSQDSRKQRFNQNCQMTDKNNNKGQDYASYGQQAGSNLEDCKSKCFKDHECKATEFRQNQCWFFKTSRGSSNSGSILSQKYCHDEQSQGNRNQNMECQMNDRQNFKGQDYSSYDQQAGSNLENCKTKCFNDFECQATEFRGGQCHFFKTSQATENSGSFLSQKSCGDQQSQRHRNGNNKYCRMNDRQNTKGEDYASYNKQAGSNIEGCKSKCFNDFECQATEFRVGQCWFFKTNQGSAASGSLLSQKDCQGHQSENGNQNKQRFNTKCRMDDKQNTKGHDYASYGTQAGSNLGDCKSKCFNDFECHATEFRQRQCMFFKTMQGSSSSGSTLSQKNCEGHQSQNQGNNQKNMQNMCEMKDKQNAKGHDYASYNKHAGSNIEDCKSKCFNDFECQSTEFRQGNCWFFKTMQGTSNTGSVLSQKYCHDHYTEGSGNKMNNQSNTWCQMKVKFNSKGQDYASYGVEIGSNIEDCKTHCFNDFICKATEFRQGQCYYFKTGQESFNTGSTLAQKYCQQGPHNQYQQGNNNGRECRMNDEQNSKGESYAIYSSEQSTSFEECKKKCFSDFECKATELRSGSCYYFKSGQATSSVGSTLSRKSCFNEEKSQDVNQYSNQMSNQMCEMRDKVNMKGQDYSVYRSETGTNFEDCKVKCYKDNECRSTEFRSAVCYFFRANTGRQNTGSTLSQKYCWEESQNRQGNQRFSQNQWCQMKDEQNAEGQDYAVYKLEAGLNTEECKSKCYKDNACKATELRSGQCLFFSNNMDTYNIGSTLSKKQCRNEQNEMCQMKDVMNAEGQNYAIYNSVVRTDVEDCKRMCYADQSCRATEHRSGSCYFFSTNTESSKTGSMVSQKWCTSDRNNQMDNNYNQNNMMNRCQMKDAFGSKGQDYAAYNTFTATNMDECKSKCYKDNECQSTELRSGSCIFFRTNQETKFTGAMLSRKVCNQGDQQNQQNKMMNRNCEMRDFMDTQGQDYSTISSYSAQNHDECKRNCFSDTECKATEFRNNFCFTFATNKGSTQTGAMLTKKFCSDDSRNEQSNQERGGSNGNQNNQNCFMQEFTNTRGQEYSMYFVSGTDFMDCKGKCFDDFDCKATEFRTGKCYFFKSGMGSSSTGNTLARKMCSSDDNQSQNSQVQGHCTMKSFRDNKGEDYAMYNFRIGSNMEECTKLCYSDYKCKATEFKQTKCYFYSTNRASFSQGGVLSKKFCTQDPNNDYQADSNKMCRMKDFRDTQGQDYASYNRFVAQNFDECRQKCYADKHCQSTEFRTGNCWFFRTKAGSQKPGSKLSKKFCSEDQYDVHNSVSKYMCQMTDAQNTKGQAYASYDVQSGATIEICRKRCFYDNHCKATEYRSGNCHMFSNNFGLSSQGFTLSRKFCYKDPAASSASFDKMFDMFSGPVNNQAGRSTLAKMWMMKQMLMAFFQRGGKGEERCEFKQFQNYRGNTYYKYEQANFADCKKKCEEDNMCKAFDVRTYFCYLYSNHQTTFSLGSRYGQKHCEERGSKMQSGPRSTLDMDMFGMDSFNNQQDIFKHGGGQGQQSKCRLNEVQNAKGHDFYRYNSATGANLEDCKTRCNADQQCKATEHRQGFCVFFSQDNVQPSQGSKVARKSCTSGNSGNQFSSNQPYQPQRINQNQMQYDYNNPTFNNVPNQAGFGNNNQQGFNNMQTQPMPNQPMSNQPMPNQPMSNQPMSNQAMTNMPNQQEFFNNNQQGFNNMPNQAGGFTNLQNQAGGFNQNQPQGNMPNQPGPNMPNNNQQGFNNNQQGFNNMPNQAGGFNQPTQPTNLPMQTGNTNMNQGNQAGNTNTNQQSPFCSMKDVKNAMGQRSTRYKNFPGQTLLDCKNACSSEAQCKGTELLQGGQCHLYTSNAMTPSNGSVVSRKVCTNI